MKKLLLLLVIVCAAPIIYVETQCISKVEPQPTVASLLPPAQKRSMVDSYLTYPEWAIVHAYEDFAGVARQKGESEFQYSQSVFGFWNNFCALAKTATREGELSFDTRTMLYTIGISFTVEFAVKAIWEKTIGMTTEWIRGIELTREDTFAHNVNDDYVKFMLNAPWYQYPFGTTMKRFWNEVPFEGNHKIRKIERRVALTLEWGVKWGYARVIGAAAGLAPAALQIQSVVSGFEPHPQIKLIAELPQGKQIETPRYRDFTLILVALAKNKYEIIEIAGNNRIFVNYIAATTKSDALIAVPLQARPGFRRYGKVVQLNDLAEFIRNTPEFEHAYDY